MNIIRRRRMDMDKTTPNASLQEAGKDGDADDPKPDKDPSTEAVNQLDQKEATLKVRQSKDINELDSAKKEMETNDQVVKEEKKTVMDENADLAKKQKEL